MRIPLEIPPGLYGDDTTFAAEGRWADGSNVRFRLSRPEVIGGWESLISDPLGGEYEAVCRSILPWTDNGELLNIAFGTHSFLEVWQGGELFDITPLGPPKRLASNPLSVTNGSPTVTVNEPEHGRTTADLIKVAGAAAIGGITPNIASVAITVTGDDTYTFTFTSNATSTVAGGGGANVVVTALETLPAGEIDGAGTIGYGTGAYGAGPYGITSPTTVYYPRTWSLAPWGEKLLASPRGGGLYEWSNDTAVKAIAVANAPTQITYMLVAPMDGGYQVFALGTQEETSGEFNPMCIRHSSIRNNTVWSTTASGSTSREYILTGGGRIVAGRMIGKYMLVWTSDALFLGTFVGALNQPWRFDRVGRNCGLIGPNAAVIVGQVAFWVGQDRQFYRYALGGEPAVAPCPIWTDFAENIAASQADKIVASSNGQFSEIRFDYPDARDGYENSRYVALSVTGPDAGAWHKGIMARTAFIDAGPTSFPLGVTYEGMIYYHERGNSADGSSFAWFIETADSYLDPDWRIEAQEIWPDFKDQQGPVTVTVKARETPQGDETEVTADPMAPGDAKADVLISGRMLKLRFAGESTPTACRIGKPVVKVERAGQQ